jgi:hypothetical protein
MEEDSAIPTKEGGPFLTQPPTESGTGPENVREGDSPGTGTTEGQFVTSSTITSRDVELVQQTSPPVLTGEDVEVMVLTEEDKETETESRPVEARIDDAPSQKTIVSAKQTVPPLVPLDISSLPVSVAAADVAHSTRGESPSPSSSHSISSKSKSKAALPPSSNTSSRKSGRNFLGRLKAVSILDVVTGIVVYEEVYSWHRNGDVANLGGSMSRRLLVEIVGLFVCDGLFTV